MKSPEIVSAPWLEAQSTKTVPTAPLPLAQMSYRRFLASCLSISQDQGLHIISLLQRPRACEPGGGSKKGEIDGTSASTQQASLIGCHGESFRRKGRADTVLALRKHKSSAKSRRHLQRNSLEYRWTWAHRERTGCSVPRMTTKPGK